MATGARSEGSAMVGIVAGGNPTPSARQLKELDMIDYFAGHHHIHQKRQCPDQVTDRRLLWRIGDARVMNSGRVQTEKVRVLRHHNPPLAGGKREMYVIVSGMQANVLSTHNVNPSTAQ